MDLFTGPLNMVFKAEANQISAITNPAQAQSYQDTKMIPNGNQASDIFMRQKWAPSLVTKIIMLFTITQNRAHATLTKAGLDSNIM